MRSVLALLRPMTDELPPFSGDDPTCPKCGHVGAYTTYYARGRCIHGGGLGDEIVSANQDDLNERLHRVCRRCDYAWDEAIAAFAGHMPKGWTP